MSVFWTPATLQQMYAIGSSLTANQLTPYCNQFTDSAGENCNQPSIELQLEVNSLMQPKFACNVIYTQGRVGTLPTAS